MSSSSSSKASRSLTIAITGGSRGLGAGMARTYLERGHRVAACSRSDPPRDLIAFADDPSCKGCLYYESGVDVCDPSAVGNFLRKISQQTWGVGDETCNSCNIDVWINNAGILNPIQSIRDTDPEEFETNLRVNLMGTFHATKAYINHCRSRAEGAYDNTVVESTLINISSGAAIKGYAGWGAYCSSKGGVDRLTECALAEEKADPSLAGRFCFRAYSIAPGVIDTDMQATIRETPKSRFPMVDKFHEIKSKDSFNTPPYIAIEIEKLALLEGPQTLPVVQRLALEKN